MKVVTHCMQRIHRKLSCDLSRLKESFALSRGGCSSSFWFSSSSSSLLDLLTEMPKVSKSAAELRHLRLKAKAAAADTPKLRPSEITLQVVGNGAKGNPRSLYVFTSQCRYMFNCGEGTQRLCHEHKMKLSKLEHIFFTYKSWENVGGLPGLSLTIQDIGVPKITIHGPPEIEQIYDMTKSFLITKDLGVVKRHHTEGNFLDNSMEVHYVPLYSVSNREANNSSRSSDVTTLHSDFESDVEETETPSRPPKKQKVIFGVDEDEAMQDMSMAYICKPFSRPGHLLLEKCIDAGVPAGPLLGELKNGRDVVLPNGKMVHSKDVVSPEEPGPVFIVLECPTLDFVESLIKEEQFIQHQMSAEDEDDVAVVVAHFSPPDVIADPRYQAWMNRFPASTFHLIMNEDNNSVSSIAVHRLQHMLHLLHPEIFPVLSMGGNQEAESNGTAATVVPAETLMQFSLRPKKGLDRSLVAKVEPETYVKEAYQNPGFQENLKILHEKLDSLLHHVNPLDDDYPEVIFLGTGSSIPSKVRNTSGILINISADSSIILDCGEGTYGQLYHFYGYDGVSTALRKIHGVFISHLHADHHLGLVQLLKARQAEFAKAGQEVLPVYLLAPHQIRYWLQNYHHNFEDIGHLYRLVSNLHLVYNNFSLVEETRDEMLKHLQLQELHSVPVRHCKHAFGVTLTTTSGHKVVYSGDTMPCNNLIAAGKGCTLLIHEATMEDDLEEEAVLKTHSTTSQAVQVGAQMEAQFTILTHFSQRYSKVPLFNDNFHSSVACAFDNMKVQLRHLPILPLFIPTLKSLFAEHYGELQERAAKRTRQKQLLQQQQAALKK